MNDAASPRLRIEDTAGLTVVHFLDPSIRPVFGGADDLEEPRDLLNLLVHQGRHDLVLGFRNVEHMCGSSVSTLWALQLRLTALGGRLRLRGLGPDVLEVFEVARVSDRFAIEDAA
jgi:hypothetical protein